MQVTKKYYAFGEDAPPLYYRPNTYDDVIINEIINGKGPANSYLFPRFEPKMCFDIGGNIGIAAVAMAKVYPKSTIYTFEPVTENFEVLKMNIEHYPNIRPLPIALGAEKKSMKIFKSDNPENLGGFSLHIESNEIGETVPVESIATICKEIGTPDFIKIDCEGAEYDILTGMPKLEKVAFITGELHGVKDFELMLYLSHNFRMKFSRDFADKVWHFHALNKGWTDFSLNPTLPE